MNTITLLDTDSYREMAARTIAQLQGKVLAPGDLITVTGIRPYAFSLSITSPINTADYDDADLLADWIMDALENGAGMRPPGVPSQRSPAGLGRLWDRAVRAWGAACREWREP